MSDLMNYLLSQQIQVHNSKPFNAYKTKTGGLVIECAVSGFAENEVKVERVGNRVYVIGEKLSKGDEEVAEFYARGLSYRSFKDSFSVGSQFKIDEVLWVNGVLKIKFREEKEQFEVKRYEPVKESA